MDSRLFKGVKGGGPSLYRLFTPCLAGTSRRDERPPTHFFVKKKFSSIGGADTATQKVSSVFCYAHTSCGGGTPSGQRDDGGGRIPMGAEIPPPAHTDRKLYPSLCRNPSAAQELPRAREGAFFFTKKAYCGNQTLCVAVVRKSVQTQPPLFPPFKSP